MAVYTSGELDYDEQPRCASPRLSVNEGYKALVPRPSAEEYKALEADMFDRGGPTEPILVNRYNVILDGHTRYEICQKHGLSYRTETRTLGSEQDEKIFVVSVNLKRRHLTDMQKVLLVKPLEDLVAEKAQETAGHPNRSNF